MRKTLFALLLVGLAMTGNAQSPAPRAIAGQELFKAGGTPILIPTPVSDMGEVGYDIRERMELFVPPVNRLLAAFLTTRDIAQFSNGGVPPALTRYALVQVPRQAEYIDVRPADFAQVVAGIQQQFSGPDAELTAQAAEEEMTRRLKALNVDKAISLGKAVPLGTFFSKSDAFGFGIVSPVSVGNKTITLAMGGAAVRVKMRVLFLYLYSEYKGQTTVDWLRNATEQWSSSLIAQNS